MSFLDQTAILKLPQWASVESAGAEFWVVKSLALVTAVLATRIGLVWAGWMRKVRR